MACRFKPRCPMFPLFQSQRILNIYQIRYCDGNFEGCARYKLASTGNMPAAELLPDGSSLPAVA